MQSDNQMDPLKEDKSQETAAAPSTTEEAKGTKVTSTQNTPEATKVFDAQQNYDALNQSYAELRREFTRRTQAEAELQKKLDSLTEMFTKATEKPFNPEQFIKDFQAQGPKALEPHFEKWIQPRISEYEKRVADAEAKSFELEKNWNLAQRENDEINYPDFTKLKPEMAKIAENPNCPVDFNRPVGEVLDALYKLAKDSSAANAIKLAKQEGRQEAEKDLAKESRTTVAGGGKAPSVSIQDPHSMSTDKLRQALIDLHGIAERD